MSTVSEIAVSLRLAPSEETLRPARRMDSEIQRDGRVLDLTDDAWREDKLPYEDVTIPLSELPEAEQDNGGSTESVKEQEMKWTDLALQSLHENTPSTGS
uniref:Anaphase-promoting complex subunit 13 n=1 Tax=Monopterus albus TaxID=43700 RepID=A0A3Q3QEA4_MONAL